MSLSSPFIRRPIATVLLSLAIIMAGTLSYFRLPVAPLPDVSFPVIMVSANLAGASPETMASTVATPIERSLGSIAGISQMTSSSSTGSTRVIIQFDMDKDINDAAREVQAALNSAQALLPSAMKSRPTYRKFNPADSPIMILSLTSSTLSQGALYSMADEQVSPRVAQAKGVGNVSVAGSSSPAIRINLNPVRLDHAGIALDQVSAAISNTNSNAPKGFVHSGLYRWEVDSNSQLFDVDSYRQLVLSDDGKGNIIRLGDVARIGRGVEDIYRVGFLNETPAVLMVVTAASGANVIETIDGIKARMTDIARSLPASAQLTTVMDRSPGIRGSLHETQLTLLLAVALVVMVVFVFLRSGRATLIPSATIPVSVLGTFGMMYLLGYSLDSLSLMALIVAIGFLVDDAIVVTENIARHIERGLPPMRAALEGAREVGFTVMSMSLSLVAVFIPLLLLGGIAGRLFHEFAMTLSITVLVSLVVSLTLTPMLCARWLKPHHASEPGRMTRWVNHLGEMFNRGYARSLDMALRHRRLTLLSLVAVIVLNGYLYAAIDKGFIPDQDTGRLMGTAKADQGISFNAMTAKLDTLRARLLANPNVHQVLGFVGGSGPGGGGSNSATLFITLKNERTQDTRTIANELTASTSDMAGMSVYMRALQDLQFGGRESNGQYEVTLKSDNLSLLNEWAPRVQEKLRSVDAITSVSSDSQSQGLSLTLQVDRDKASRLGVDMTTIDTLLQGAFSQKQVASVYQGAHQYYVIMALDARYRRSADILSRLHVFNRDGDRIPLSAFSHVERTNTPVSVSHQNQFAATTVSFNLADGATLDAATTRINEALDQLGLPTAIQAGFEGGAARYQEGASAMPLIILGALVTVYLVLGILYESYIHPLTILSTLPSAGIGALLLLMLLGKPFTLIAAIGIILLIGVVKKNAIMLVDFALDAERNRKLPPLEAIREAALVRFRPIMMTTLAAILGALPLMFGTDENADIRAPLGISIVGGLIVSQLLTLYTTPVVYLYLDKLRRGRKATDE
ncbi:efflux RND transporter permease subunit [Larsenimonas rhizosphaerae]|uniref:Efflux RND transporter permease subunit n=1 Tax=Larsenimonas rhizosphaerae TaxID=2944682 RepID=A0AA41ZKR0_9GAMM|nr:efflux RND transporter permease subunit [Larsenimonas rhizosphaerae]MCX2523841.1 efflux RND transporter permease subunit [Larsenimonas rhizosphaerae]